jgi:tetratricopeptide (TPR) repeat protein
LIQTYFDSELDLPPWLVFKTDTIEEVYFGPTDLRYWYGSNRSGFWIREREEIMDPRGFSTAVVLRDVETFGYSGWFCLKYKLHLDQDDELTFETRATSQEDLDALNNQFHVFFSKFPELEPKAKLREILWKLRNTFAHDGGKRGIQLAQEALTLDSNNVEARFWLGSALGVANRYEEAVEQFKKVIQANPNHQDAYYNLGLTYYRLEKYSKAIETLEVGLAINPDNHPILFWLGKCYELIENPSEALRYYRRAIETAPEKSSGYIRGISFLREAEAAVVRYSKEKNSPEK